MNIMLIPVNYICVFHCVANGFFWGKMCQFYFLGKILSLVGGATGL